MALRERGRGVGRLRQIGEQHGRGALREKHHGRVDDVLARRADVERFGTLGSRSGEQLDEPRDRIARQSGLRSDIRYVEARRASSHGDGVGRFRGGEACPGESARESGLDVEHGS